ncbi:MAG: hypothetical protein KDJ69_08310 [Nitratireductor sp.]|nr:hypothetical protein [Nitratireductor sp.]
MQLFSNIQHKLSVLLVATSVVAASNLIVPGHAHAEQLNIDIGKDFDWSSDRLHRMSGMIATTFNNRCEVQCEIRVRVYTDAGISPGLRNRVERFKRVIVSRMAKHSSGEIRISDVYLLL